MIKRVYRNFNNKLINKSRLLHIYISLLIDLESDLPYTYQALKERLKKDFDYDTSLINISNYFESNFYENRLDVEQQMKNLGIKYD